MYEFLSCVMSGFPKPASTGFVQVLCNPCCALGDINYILTTNPLIINHVNAMFAVTKLLLSAMHFIVQLLA